MLDDAPGDPYQLIRLPSEYLLICTQEPDQGLLLLRLEVGAYGESGTRGPVLVDGYLLGFCLVLGEQQLLLGGRSPLGSGVPASVGCADAAVLKVSLSTRRASPVSPCTVRVPLLPGIYMRLYAGCVAAMNWASAG